MANLFAESFQHYARTDSTLFRAQIATKWDATSSTDLAYPNATGGRNGGPAMDYDFSTYLRKTLGVNATTLIGGVRWRNLTHPLALPASSAVANVMYLLDGVTFQCGLWIDNAGKLFVVNGAGTSLGDSGSWTTDIGTLHFYEMKVAFGSLGSVEVRVDGIPRVTLSNVNTIHSGNSYANVFAIGTNYGGGAPSYRVCDAYVNDTTGSLNTDFEGDINIDYFQANGAGTYQQSTIAGSAPAATRWQGVAEQAPDDDVTGNDLTTGQQDTFTVDTSALPSTAVVRSVQAVARFASDVAGTNTDALLLRSGTTDHQGPDVGATTAYGYGTMPLDTDPATGAAWTLAAARAVEVGTVKTA